MQTRWAFGFLLPEIDHSDPSGKKRDEIADTAIFVATDHPSHPGRWKKKKQKLQRRLSTHSNCAIFHDIALSSALNDGLHQQMPALFAEKNLSRHLAIKRFAVAI